MSELLLAMDTSTSAVTVALVSGAEVVAEQTVVDARRHTEILMPLVRDLFDGVGVTRANVTALAVGVGPGPFTGLRVGITTAATLSYVLGVPAHGVCSLDAIAHQAATSDVEEFVVATDARRKEVYWARYVRGERESEPQVHKPAGLPDEVRALPAAGRGARLYPEVFASAMEPADVSAAHLGLLVGSRLRDGGELLPLQPLYLRQPDAVPSAGQKSALTSLAGQRRRP